MNTPEWDEYLRAHGYNPTAFTDEPAFCEICNVAVGDDLYVILEPPFGLSVRRKFHCQCLISHLLAQLDNADDNISNCLTIKP